MASIASLTKLEVSTIQQILSKQVGNLQDRSKIRAENGLPVADHELEDAKRIHASFSTGAVMSQVDLSLTLEYLERALKAVNFLLRWGVTGVPGLITDTSHQEARTRREATELTQIIAKLRAVVLPTSPVASPITSANPLASTSLTQPSDSARPPAPANERIIPPQRDTIGMTELDRAIKLTQTGEFDDALVIFDRLLEGSPGNPDILFERAFAKDRKGDLAGALVDYDALIDNTPEYRNALYNRGNIHRCQGRYELAIADFDRHLAVNPRDYEALAWRASCRLSDNDTQGGLADACHALEFKSDWPEAVYQHARALMALGKWKESLDEFNCALRLDPSFVKVYYHRAWCKSKVTDYRGAIEDYDRYLQHHANNVDCYIFRGTNRLDAGDYHRAAEDYERAISLDSTQESNLRPWVDKVRNLEHLECDGPAQAFAEACCERGWGKVEANQNQAAVDWFNRALDACQDHADAWVGRGGAYANLGHYQESFEDCTRAIELKPDLPKAWMFRAYVRGMLGDFRNALSDAEKAVEIAPHSGLAYFRRARTKQELNDHNGAIADFTRNLDIEPNSEYSWLNRGWSLSIVGKLADAIADYSRAIELAPNCALAWSNRGYAKRDSGDTVGAIADFRQAIALDSSDAETLHQTIAKWEKSSTVAAGQEAPVVALCVDSASPSIEKAPTKPAVPSGPQHYAAIAYSSAAAQWGVSYRHADQAAAEQAAMQNCKYDDAQIVAWTQGGICALALGDNPIAWATAWGQKKKAVIDDAWNAYTKANSGCYIAAIVSSENGILYEHPKMVSSAIIKSMGYGFQFGCMLGMFWGVLQWMSSGRDWPPSAAIFVSVGLKSLQFGAAFGCFFLILGVSVYLFGRPATYFKIFGFGFD